MNLSADAGGYPEITTERLRLRGFCDTDAKAVAGLAGHRDVAATTLAIPHPYPRREADRWIESHHQAFVAGEGISLAITLREDGQLVGAIGLSLDGEHRKAELGYWIGREFWGRGYATEAAAAMLEYGFEVMELNRIYAHHMQENQASGRVLVRIGLEPEGILREHVLKWGEYKDLVLYGLTRGRYRSPARIEAES
jgi:[ribosomal protein S5]-alanine N-acetyltransferase